MKAVLGRRPRPGSLQPAFFKELRDRTAPLITPLPPLLLRPFTALSPLATRHLTPFNNRPHVERAHFARCCVNMRPLPETSSPDKAEAKLLCSTFSEGAVKAWQRYPRPTSLMAARHMAAVRWLSSIEAHRRIQRVFRNRGSTPTCYADRPAHQALNLGPRCLCLCESWCRATSPSPLGNSADRHFASPHGVLRIHQLPRPALALRFRAFPPVRCWCCRLALAFYGWTAMCL